MSEFTGHAFAPSVCPEDSASRGGSPIFSSDIPFDGSVGATVENFSGILQTLLSAYSTMDKDSYRRFSETVDSVVKSIDKSVGYQCAAVRLASTSSLSSKSVSPTNSGVSLARGSFGAGSKRASRVTRLSAGRPVAVPDGFCYSKLLKASAAESVATRLGQWPALSSLLREPFSHFQSLDDLDRFRLEGGSEAVHVRAGGASGSHLLSSFAGVAQGLKLSKGSFGAVLRASAVESSDATLKVTTKTVVGGDRFEFSRQRFESLAGLFEGDAAKGGVALGSVCPVSYGASMAVFVAKGVDPDFDMLTAFGVKVLSAVGLVINNVEVDVIFLTDRTVPEGNVSVVLNSLLDMQHKYSAGCVDIQSFYRLTGTGIKCVRYIV